MAERRVRTCDLCQGEPAWQNYANGHPIDLCDKHLGAKFQVVSDKAAEIAAERALTPKATSEDKHRWGKLVVGV